MDLQFKLSSFEAVKALANNLTVAKPDIGTRKSQVQGQATVYGLIKFPCFHGLERDKRVFFSSVRYNPSTYSVTCSKIFDTHEEDFRQRVEFANDPVDPTL